MNRRDVVVDMGTLTVAFDDPPPSAQRWRALAIGQARDETTGLPTFPRVSGTTDRLGITLVGGPDGSFHLRARPWLAFPPLLAAAYNMSVFIEADAYLGSRLDVTVPSRHRHVIAPAPAAGTASLHLDDVTGLQAAQLLLVGPAATFEHARIRHLGPAVQEVTLEGTFRQPHAIGDPVVADAWPPIDVGVVDLRRAPLVIRGRAVRRDAAANTVTPVVNAVISVLDFWWTLADLRALLPGAMTDPNPATRAFLLAISPGASAARPVAAAVVDQPLVPIAADDRRLVDAAPALSDRELVVSPPAAHRFRISSRQAIAPGGLLQVDGDRPDASETVTVLNVTGFGPPDQSGSVDIALPFRAFHRAGSPIVRVIPLASGVPAALRRATQPGDRCLFVSDLSVFPPTGDIRLTGGGAPAEFQRARRFDATSDIDGYFALPAIHRVAALELRAAAPLLAPIEFMLHPEYGQQEQWIDVPFA